MADSGSLIINRDTVSEFESKLRSRIAYQIAFIDLAELKLLDKLTHNMAKTYSERYRSVLNPDLK